MLRAEIGSYAKGGRLATWEACVMLGVSLDRMN